MYLIWYPEIKIFTSHVLMPDTRTPHSDNLFENDNIVVGWCGRRISRLITLWVPRESIVNSSPSLNIIINDNRILISITVNGYDNSSFQFNLPLTPTLECHQVYFQRLSRNDRFRGQQQTFDEIVVSIRSRPGGCVFLCH